LLFWPRGAAAAFGATLSEAYKAGADYLHAAIDYLTGRRAGPPPSDIADASGARLDDALRQYLAERGAKSVDLASVTALANGAARLRLAGTAVVKLADPRAAPDDGLAAPVAVLAEQTDQVSDWYRTLGNVLDGHPGDPLPAPSAAVSDQSFLDVSCPGWPTAATGRAPTRPRSCCGPPSTWGMSAGCALTWSARPSRSPRRAATRPGPASCLRAVARPRGSPSIATGAPRRPPRRRRAGLGDQAQRVAADNKVPGDHRRRPAAAAPRRRAAGWESTGYGK
jgi:hypothetical protein